MTKPFHLRLTITPLESGGVDATHTFLSAEDASIAGALPGHGIQHIAQALLLEALRRETYLIVLGELTKDPQFLTRYLQGSPDEREALEQETGETVARLFNLGAEKLSPGVAAWVFAMLTNPEGVEHKR